MKARWGGMIKRPESPMQEGIDTKPVDETKGRVTGNPLPNLGAQWRLTHGDPPKAIPLKPINPAILEAREYIKNTLEKEEPDQARLSNTIKNDAKRKVKSRKKEGKELNSNEVDLIMIGVYLDSLSLEKYKNKAGVEKVIKDLTTEKENIEKDIDDTKKDG